jgi:1,4-dihydroxy-2-naphthoyl-CoA hydrolase
MPLRHDVTLASLNQRGNGHLPGLIGFRVTALEEGMLVAELDVRPELRAPNGYLHAATVIALADTASGYGCLAHLPDGAENFTTVELKSNFLGTAREGTIVAVARPVHTGNTTQVWDAVVRRKVDDKPIALFRCTQMILWPRVAQASQDASKAAR